MSPRGKIEPWLPSTQSIATTRPRRPYSTKSNASTTIKAASAAALEGVQDGDDVAEIDRVVGFATALGAGDVDVYPLAAGAEGARETVEYGYDVQQADFAVRPAAPAKARDVAVEG